MNINRRKWLKRAAVATVLAPIAGLSYGYLETGWIEVTQTTIPVPNLPSEFSGLRVAVLTDIHHGPLTPLSYVRRVVNETMKQNADLIVLVGDFVAGRTGTDHFQPCFEELGRLSARHGVFAVPGNHDYWERVVRYFGALKKTSIQDLTNNGLWLYEKTSRLRLGGVDDQWCGHPSLAPALGNANADDACLLLCHNPDFVEQITDSRVGLVFAGHMHGGQIRIPFVQTPVPSNYGNKYLKGLVQGPVAQVYVSRGIGTVSVPFRFRARPEIAIVTLAG